MNPNSSVVETVDQEMPSVNETVRRSNPMAKGIAVLVLLLIGVLGLGGAYIWYMKQPSTEVANIPVDEPKGSIGKMFDGAPPPPPEFSAADMAPMDDVPPPPPGTDVPALGASGQSQTTETPKPQLDRSASGLMVVESDQSQQQGQQAVTPGAYPAGYQLPGQQQPPASPQGLASSLTATTTEPNRASMLGDRNMTIAKGAMIDCVLKTRLDTTVPGMSSCVVTRNIYSDNGRVLLIERGSEVTGEYTQGVQMGQNRIFVLWNRLKTPNGVIVNLDSPGTDSLGAAGLGGKIKHHFWRRFGAALLVSIVQDAADYASSRNNGGTTINTGNTSDAASEMANTILQSSINIPPTLYKNQGERVSIFVARDLYFGDVYGLRAN